MENLLSFREVSERLGLSIDTIRSYVSQKKLNKISLSKRSVRIKESDLARFIEQGSEVRKAS
jgi:excisionase family DNA binding protein